jgi:hypothetical protein
MINDVGAELGGLVGVSSSFHNWARTSDTETKDVTNHPWRTILMTAEAMAAPREPLPPRSGHRNNRRRYFRTTMRRPVGDNENDPRQPGPECDLFKGRFELGPGRIVFRSHIR